MKETFDQSTFRNSFTKLDFYSNNYFYCITHKNITDKFTIIQDICKLVETDLISSMRFERNQVTLILTLKNFICILWTRFAMTGNIYLEMKLLKNSFSKHFATNQGARKIKAFLKLSNEKICLIFQPNNTKYMNIFKFISCSIFMKEYDNLGPNNWCKIFTDWFTKSSDGCISFNLV